MSNNLAYPLSMGIKFSWYQSTGKQIDLKIVTFPGRVRARYDHNCVLVTNFSNSDLKRVVAVMLGEIKRPNDLVGAELLVNLK